MSAPKKIARAAGTLGAAAGSKLKRFSRELHFETGEDERLFAETAADDLQRPPEASRATYGALGSKDKTWIEAGTSSGFSLDFGHDDLVAGGASPTEVFPRIRAWLDERSVSDGKEPAR